MTSVTIGWLAALLLLAAGVGAGWFARDRVERRRPTTVRVVAQPVAPSPTLPPGLAEHVRQATPLRPVQQPIFCTLSGRDIRQCPPEHLHFPARRTPELPPQVAATRLHPATVPAAPTPRPTRQPRPESKRGRHWTVSAVHNTQAITAVDPTEEGT